MMGIKENEYMNNTKLQPYVIWNWHLYDHINIISSWGAFEISSLRINWKLSTILKTSKNAHECLLICKGMHILKVQSIIEIKHKC